MDRAEIQQKYGEIQKEIDFYLEQKEKAEIDYIKARTTLYRLEDKLEHLSKEMIKLIIEKNN
jgi:hypothetical protein